MKSGNPRGRGGAPAVPTGKNKYYVCGPCLRTDDPVIIQVSKEGLEEFNKHKESHGKADK